MKNKVLISITAGTLFVSCLLTASGQADNVFDGKRMAVVEFSANFMREAPDYTAELGNQGLMGSVVEIVGENGYWRQVVTHEPYKAWVTEMGLVEMSADGLKDYIGAPKFICTASHSSIYSAPDKDSEVVSEFVLGDLVRIFPERRNSSKYGKAPDGRNKYNTDNGDARGQRARYGKKGGFAKVMLPSGKTGFVATSDIEIFSQWVKRRKSTPADVIDVAKEYLGVPYMWGGTSIKNVDCSGLVSNVFFLNGALLPRNASQQAAVGMEVEVSLGNYGGLRPGDLLFFGRKATEHSREAVTHVGIYLGDGKFIHSAQIVRISSVRPDDADYYEGMHRLLRARRVCGFEDAGLGIVSIERSPYYFPSRE